MIKLEPPNRIDLIAERIAFVAMTAGVALALEAFGYTHAVWLGDAMTYVALAGLAVAAGRAFARFGSGGWFWPVLTAIFIVALFDRLNLNFLEWLRTERSTEVAAAGFNAFQSTYTLVLGPLSIAIAALVALVASAR